MSNSSSNDKYSDFVKYHARQWAEKDKGDYAEETFITTIRMGLALKTKVDVAKIFLGVSGNELINELIEIGIEEIIANISENKTTLKKWSINEKSIKEVIAEAMATGESPRNTEYIYDGLIAALTDEEHEAQYGPGSIETDISRPRLAGRPRKKEKPNEKSNDD